MPVQPNVHPKKTPQQNRPVQPAPDGVGPLLQRDFVGVIDGSARSPEEIIRMVREEFPRFPPHLLARFSRPEGESGPMRDGDTMHVFMPGGGHSGVVLTHFEPRSFTLRTLEGHFEAGMITFGADYDEAGRIVFRIRSRSTIERPIRLLMYRLMGGIRMQTQIWTTFVRRVAEATGGRLIGDVLVSTDHVRPQPMDRRHVEHPTFQADENRPPAGGRS